MPYTRSCVSHYLTLPMQLLPQEVRYKIAAQILNMIFHKERNQGDLDFLENHQVRIALADANLDVLITLKNRQIYPITKDETPELTISGTIYDYLLLIAGREDPDTLFFQRRLSMQGDTGLGVHLKNFLAAIDYTTLPLGNFIQPTVNKGLSFYEWLM
ncbi:hypothetical protein TI05_01260 [Achromatium sp. WMS3]|nr:hypothetical protein TI05_01260 [Achromatium sp. WMS3]